MRGTEFRDRRGLYHILGRKFPSVTTVRDEVWPKDQMGRIISNRVASKAARLFDQHLKGEMAHVLKRSKSGSIYVPAPWETEEVNPADLLLDQQYLAGEYERQRQKDLDRGTVTHMVPEWFIAGHDADEIETLAEEYMAEHQLVCTVDETIGYCLALYDWMAMVQPDVIGVEIPVVNTVAGYAGTVDLLAEINGDLYVIDFKTSRKTDLTHAVQLAAYCHATNSWDEDQNLMPWPLPKELMGMIVLVSPDKVTPRVLVDTGVWYDVFQDMLSVYHNVQSEKGVFQTEKELVWSLN